MPQVKYPEIVRNLKNGKFAPVYLLHGDEPFFIDKISKYITGHVLTEEEKAFNQAVLYGRDCTVKEIIDHARQYPMMASRRVIILKEAQTLRGIQDLEHYVLKPTPTTVLVICHKYKKVDGRSSFYKATLKEGIVFESAMMRDNEIPSWISAYCKEHRHHIDPEAAVILTDYLGNDLSKIGGELDKLFLTLSADNTLSKELVFDNIGLSREYNVFEFQKALGQKDLKRVYTILKNFMANPKSNPLIMVISLLFSFYNKLYITKSMSTSNDQDLAGALGMRSTYFVREYRQAAKFHSMEELENIIAILKEFDLRSKGKHIDHLISSEDEILREMVQQILSAGESQRSSGNRLTKA